MDPLTAPILAATLTALTTTTASEAAKTAWNGLLSLVRRHFGTHSAEDTATTAVTSDDPATATHAAHTILAAATSHPDFAHELSECLRSLVRLCVSRRQAAVDRP